MDILKCGNICSLFQPQGFCYFGIDKYYCKCLLSILLWEAPCQWLDIFPMKWRTCLHPCLIRDSNSGPQRVRRLRYWTRCRKLDTEITYRCVSHPDALSQAYECEFFRWLSLLWLWLYFYLTELILPLKHNFILYKPHFGITSIVYYLGTGIEIASSDTRLFTFMGSFRALYTYVYIQYKIAPTHAPFTCSFPVRLYPLSPILRSCIL